LLDAQRQAQRQAEYEAQYEARRQEYQMRRDQEVGVDRWRIQEDPVFWYYRWWYRR
jgi:hypothetical protein